MTPDDSSTWLEVERWEDLAHLETEVEMVAWGSGRVYEPRPLDLADADC